MAMTKEDVIKAVKDQDIEFIRLWFTDVVGVLKSFAITPKELELALEEGMGFDGSSIQGFCRIDESDMVAMPDPSTFTLLPWRGGKVAKMFTDVLKPDGTPYEGDPRYVLRRNLKKAADLGYTMFVGPELEFFYFKDACGTEILDNGGYFDLTPLDVASDLRRDTIKALESMDIPVEYSHHEVAPSQHEIDLRYAEALKMADSAMTYRLTVKEIAMAHGVYATFMPKPLFGENGSGMHVHQSLFKDGRNSFYDANDPQSLSATCKSYIAGLLKHAPEITSLVAQWVNSYKRLVPGYEARCIWPGPSATVPAWCGCPCTNPARKTPPAANSVAPIPRPTPTWRSPVCWPQASRELRKAMSCPPPLKRTSLRWDRQTSRKRASSPCPAAWEKPLKSPPSPNWSRNAWATMCLSSTWKINELNGINTASMSASGSWTAISPFCNNIMFAA
jgi:glutamine synthetase